MRFKERLDKFLKLQNSNMRFEDISKELEISPSTLRSFLNKRGYKYDSGKYILKEKSIESKKSNTKKENNKDIIIKEKASIKTKPKKDRKINVTQEDLDKLCEVYDWYLEVKDNKSIKLKNSKSNKRDIKIENTEIKNIKTTSIKVDKNVWENFERLCSNSKYSKSEIITQALLDFMKVHKSLL